MPDSIPSNFLDLLNTPTFAHLATIMPDGRPQVTPVWCDFDGTFVRFNTARGRQKDRNVRRDPRVALSLLDVSNPYRYMEIRGEVVEITEQGADEHINQLSKKYLGKDKYPFARAGEVREICKIKPERVRTQG